MFNFQTKGHNTEIHFSPTSIRDLKKGLNREVFKVLRSLAVKINKSEDQEVLKKNSDSDWAIKA